MPTTIGGGGYFHLRTGRASLTQALPALNSCPLNPKTNPKNFRRRFGGSGPTTMLRRLLEPRKQAAVEFSESGLGFRVAFVTSGLGLSPSSLGRLPA